MATPGPLPDWPLKTESDAGSVFPSPALKDRHVAVTREKVLLQAGKANRLVSNLQVDAYCVCLFRVFILTWVSVQEPLQPESAGPVGSAAEPPWLWGSTWPTAALDSASTYSS